MTAVKRRTEGYRSGRCGLVSIPAVLMFGEGEVLPDKELISTEVSVILPVLTRTCKHIKNMRQNVEIRLTVHVPINPVTRLLFL